MPTRSHWPRHLQFARPWALTGCQGWWLSLPSPLNPRTEFSSGYAEISSGSQNSAGYYHHQTFPPIGKWSYLLSLECYNIAHQLSAVLCGATVTHGTDPPVVVIHRFWVFRIQFLPQPCPSLSLPLCLSVSLSLCLSDSLPRSHSPPCPRRPSVPAICPSLGIDMVRRGAERCPPGATGLGTCNLPVPGH